MFASPLDEALFGWDLHGKTLGVLGFGHIGQAVARRAALVFGMPVIYLHPRVVTCPDLAGQVSAVSQPERLAHADFLVLCLPLIDETRGLMNAHHLATGNLFQALGGERTLG